MLTYTEAQDLMKKARHGRRKLENNTYLEERGDSFAIRLHDTDIVMIHPNGVYTLDSGGWRTVTTKDRISHYSPAVVSSVKHRWFAYPFTDARGFTDFTRPVPFVDGMEVRHA